MDRQPVTSGAVVSVGHDPDSNVLEVEFKGGRIYQYDDVSAEQHATLTGAESVGKHFAEHFRSNPDIKGRRIETE